VRNSRLLLVASAVFAAPARSGPRSLVPRSVHGSPMVTTARDGPAGLGHRPAGREGVTVTIGDQKTRRRRTRKALAGQAPTAAAGGPLEMTIAGSNTIRSRTCSSARCGCARASRTWAGQWTSPPMQRGDRRCESSEDPALQVPHVMFHRAADGPWGSGRFVRRKPCRRSRGSDTSSAGTCNRRSTRRWPDQLPPGVEHRPSRGCQTRTRCGSGLQADLRAVERPDGQGEGEETAAKKQISASREGRQASQKEPQNVTRTVGPMHHVSRSGQPACLTPGDQPAPDRVRARSVRRFSFNGKIKSADYHTPFAARSGIRAKATRRGRTITCKLFLR